MPHTVYHDTGAALSDEGTAYRLMMSGRYERGSTAPAAGEEKGSAGLGRGALVRGAPSLGGMNDTYRPGAFYNYMGLPHGATRTYMEPGDASPTKKLAQLKELLDQNTNGWFWLERSQRGSP